MDRSSFVASVEKAPVMCRSLCVESASRSARSAVRGSLIGVALLCSACAAQHAPSGVAGPQPPPPTATYVGSWKLQVEADGLPAQHAPRQRDSTPDDPAEPWSPNYGSAPVRAPSPPPAPIEPTRKAERASEKAAPTSAAAARHIVGLDAEDIIRRAVAAHEMRRQD